MKQASWHLHDHEARLQCGELAAVVDLWRPDRGLGSITLNSCPVLSDRILAVELPPIVQGGLGGIDYYQRGGDLIATYSATDDWPLRTQVYWRAWFSSKVRDAAAVELVASVQTNLLDSHPRIFAGSRLAACGVRRLASSESERFECCTPDARGALVFTPHDGYGCTLIELPGNNASYAEMVHPVDFVRSELAWAGSADADGTRMVSLRHPLFAENLEKGVILRARVLAVLVRREHDAADVAALYREFATSRPPLTT